MSLLEMSLSGGLLILAVAAVRALTLNQLPKGTFLALWAVALARLLLPFSLPSPVSVWSLAPELPALPAPVRTPPAGGVTAPPASGGMYAAPSAGPAPALSAGGGGELPVWTLVWLAGAVLCALYFLISYLRCRRELGTALPVEAPELESWRQAHRLRRTVALRQTDRVSAPLTYGVIRPVIIFPKTTNWSDKTTLAWVLEHELVHIRRFDALTKLVLAAAACVHWFNPLVWVMLLLANRDIELSCDEAVVRRLGLERRSGYARALLTLEAEKSGLGPFASAFSRSAIEERIFAIMKMKKTSLLGLVLAAVLVCAMGAAFATSAAEAEPEDLREYLSALPEDEFTEEESQRLFALWIDGYEDMTAADYRERMRGERTDADMALIERFSLSEMAYSLPAGPEADALAAFNDYFFNLYEPLTADQWKTRSFDAGANGTFYQYSLTILDENALTVGAYDRIHKQVEEALRQPMADAADAYGVEQLSTPALQVELGYYIASFRGEGTDPDEALHAASSQEAAAQWDRQLAPYVPFGLTYRFDDPDLDGNGLTMWFNGREVRGILDEREGVWITEHAGITAYPADAVELYVVYGADGQITGLREATAEEKAVFTQDRVQTSGAAGLLEDGQELREFPNATRGDYDSILALRTRGYEDMTLADFNQRLLDWGNANGEAYDRIMCDVIWNDCAVDLTEEEWRFVSHTCRLSGNENAMRIRSLYTGRPEEDPGFAANLPMLSAEIDGVTAAWCNLYYDLTYHVSDRSACTVGERDACAAAMESAIQGFWRDTSLDTLLTLSEAEVAERFNAWAERCGTDHVSFCHVTEDHIHYECADERYLCQERQDHHPEPADHHGGGRHG